MRGCASESVIGTYLHGPLLPKNAWFADWLIASAIGIGDGLGELDESWRRGTRRGAAGGRGGARMTRPRRDACLPGSPLSRLLAGAGTACAALAIGRGLRLSPPGRRSLSSDRDDDPRPRRCREPVSRTVTIGDKNYTEQFVLGELYYLALQGEGFTVSLNRNIGPTQVTLQALTSGQLGIYPEYLSTWNSSDCGIYEHGSRRGGRHTAPPRTMRSSHGM